LPDNRQLPHVCATKDAWPIGPDIATLRHCGCHNLANDQIVFKIRHL
jgi:hypothetical protein